jgi:PKD repeat protein
MITRKQVISALAGMLLLPLTYGSAKAELQADFTASTRSGSSPVTVKFTDLSKGNPTSWKWDLGNGFYSFRKNPTASYVQPGTYHIKLVVKNIQGVDSVIKSQFIVVEPKPTVAFDASVKEGCFPLAVQFSDKSTAIGAIVQREWDFGDGTTSTNAYPQHIYQTAGTFSVTLKITDSKGYTRKLTQPSFITIQEGVRADFTLTAKPGCLPVNFENTSTGTSAMSFQWSFGDGKTSEQAEPDHTFVKSGNYSVQLTATTESGCTKNISKEIAILMTPQPNGSYTRQVKIVDKQQLDYISRRSVVKKRTSK